MSCSISFNLFCLLDARYLDAVTPVRRWVMSKRKLDADELASGGSKPEAAGGTEGQQKPSLAKFVDL